MTKLSRSEGVTKNPPNNFNFLTHKKYNKRKIKSQIKIKNLTKK